MYESSFNQLAMIHYIVMPHGKHVINAHTCAVSYGQNYFVERRFDDLQEKGSR